MTHLFGLPIHSMEPADISLNAIELLGDDKYHRQNATFTQKVFALTPIPKDVLEPHNATCILCDDMSICVTKSVGSHLVPRQARACAKYIINQIGFSWTPIIGFVITKEVLRQDADLTTYADRAATEIAYTAITQHRDNRLLILLCNIVRNWGIIKQAPFVCTDPDDEIDDRITHEACFIDKVRHRYPDTRWELERLCPLALYTFDSDDSSFELPACARADFLKERSVMQFISVIWPRVASDAWTYALAMYHRDILDVRNSYRRL